MLPDPRCWQSGGCLERHVLRHSLHRTQELIEWRNRCLLEYLVRSATRRRNCADEVGVIENIKRVHARLQAITLVDLESPADRGIEGYIGRAPHSVAAEIAERADRVRREGSRIDELHASGGAVVANRIGRRRIREYLVKFAAIEPYRRRRIRDFKGSRIL